MLYQLMKYGISGKLFHITKSIIYGDLKICVKMVGPLSEYFSLKTGRSSYAYAVFIIY